MPTTPARSPLLSGWMLCVDGAERCGTHGVTGRLGGRGPGGVTVGNSGSDISGGHQQSRTPVAS